MKKILFGAITSCALLMSCGETPQNNDYSIDLRVADKTVETDFLKMGGTSPDGGSIDFNSYYMSIDGKPHVAIMGEVHFSRIPNEQWEETILKMKAGGINLIATYVFWSMHEAYEGQFDFSGDLNVRKFVELCRRHDMNVVMRIGPFCHGEIRNGGIPDWLYGRPFQIRTNDEEYLKYVDRLYGKIAEQLDGLYYKDGGNIVAIQLENELQHSAAPWAFSYPGQEREYTVADYDIDNTKIGVSVQENEIQGADMGARHLVTLREIAQSKGMITPFYTVTGWGNAAVIPGETIPVTSAYPYPFWSEGVEASPFYLFKDIQAHPDYEPVRYEATRYPSFCAEMGAGITMIWSRRPRVPAKAAEGLMLRSLGSGANGIGYYMYTGGTTPRGPYGFYSDEPMGVPKMSYDFQAPIGEFGKTRDTYGVLRLLHSFVADFGDRLAPMGVVLPEGWETITPEDSTTLRYAVRKYGDSGFVFITNFQDHVDRREISDVRLSLQLNDETIMIPFSEKNRLDIVPEANIILPFNFAMESVLLKSATAQPLARIYNGGKAHYFFFAPDGVKPEFRFDETTLAAGSESVMTPEAGWKNTVALKAADGSEVLMTVLTREEAISAVKIGDSLILSTADVLQYHDKLRFQQTSENLEIVSFPAMKAAGFNHEARLKDKTDYAASYTVSCEPVKVEPEVTEGNYRRWMVHVPEKAFEGVSDLILNIDYVGDTCAAFIDGAMVTDHFYSGSPWRIGLKRFSDRLEKDGMYFYFRPMTPDAPYLIDLPEDQPIDFSKGNVLEVRSISVVPEYAFDYTLKH